MTVKKLQEKLRNAYLREITDAMTAADHDVLRTAANEIAIPCCDEENNEQWIVVRVSVPTGSRDGEPYDGFTISEEYAQHCAEREAKQRAAAEAKAKKMEKDAKARAQRNSRKKE